MTIREGAWDCRHCERARNAGSSKYCGSCGKPRGEDIEFYLPEDARVVDADDELARASCGPDWTCASCNGDNPGQNAFCSGCGSPQDGQVKRTTKMLLSQPAQQVVPETGSGCVRRLGIGAALLVLMMFVGCYFLTRTHVATLRVQGLSWQRSIDIEKFAMGTEEGWQDLGEVPSQARVLSRSKQLRETRQVQTGTVSKTRTVTQRVQTGTEKVKVGVKDMGNGYFEDIYEEQPVYGDQQVEESYDEPTYRDEPIYDTKVRYEIERWRKETTSELKGQDNQPKWPEVAENSKQRAGPRHEKYEVKLEGGGKTYTYAPQSETDFQRFSVDQEVLATISSTGKVKALEPK